jgi:UrcA family protein
MTSIASRNEKLQRAGIAVAAALSTVLLAHTVSAAPNDTVQIRVTYSDLDLSTAAGAQTLYRRIKGAAYQACKSHGRFSTLMSRTAWRRCYDGAVADAVAQVDRPSLTALQNKEESARIAARS